jgi:succinate dehydrogenase / fumarate reductase, iron-sulfur subunit
VADKTVRFIIKRQPTPDAEPHWEEFDLRFRPGMNVISGLMDIAENPVDRFGKPTTPVTYDSNCLEEVCGSCAMLINGRAAMACSALVHKLQQPIRLEPLSRFRVIRDLAGDRSVLFENLKRVKAWVPVDGTYDLGPGPRVDPETQQQMYPLSRCISCCLCLEVCPQVTMATGFVGAAIINQVRLFNEHPTGKSLKTDRLHAMMGDGGIHECSYAQNCVQICPKGIPLTTSISIVNGQVMKQAVGDLFHNPELAWQGEAPHRHSQK